MCTILSVTEVRLPAHTHLRQSHQARVAEHSLRWPLPVPSTPLHIGRRQGLQWVWTVVMTQPLRSGLVRNPDEWWSTEPDYPTVGSAIQPSFSARPESSSGIGSHQPIAAARATRAATRASSISSDSRAPASNLFAASQPGTGLLGKASNNLGPLLPFLGPGALVALPRQPPCPERRRRVDLRRIARRRSDRWLRRLLLLLRADGQLASRSSRSDPRRR